MDTVRFLHIEPSTNKGKKWKATFYDVSEHPVKTIHFGASGYEDYTIHKDDKRKRSYLARHSNEDWSNPMTAGALSRWILWEYTDFDQAVKAFEKRFNLSPLV